jgi:hypothetical protein
MFFILFTPICVDIFLAIHMSPQENDRQKLKKLFNLHFMGIFDDLFVVKSAHGVPEVIQVSSKTFIQRGVEPMVEHNNLKIVFIRMGSDQDIPRMRVTVDMSIEKYHLGKGSKKLIAYFFQLEFALQGIDFIYFDAIDEFHGNDASGTKRLEIFRNINRIVKLKIFASFFGVSDLI